MATIKDRSDGGASVIHAFGHQHLSTSDARAHADQKDLEGAVSIDNQPSQNPHIPPKHESAEVSVVGQNIEPCTAAYAERGGVQADGLTAMSPVVAKLEGGFVVKAMHQGLNQAHDASTITHQDHRDILEHGVHDVINRKCDLAKPGGLETITELAEGKGIPPATKAVSVSLGHPVRAKSGVPPFGRPVFKSTEPVIMSNSPASGDVGAATPVVARVVQPRASESRGYVVKEG